MDQNQSDRVDYYSQLIKAAKKGDIELLYELLEKDSSILDKADRQFTDNPLHVAVSNNHLFFAAEIANLKPSLAKRRNHHGWSPLHIAAENGQVEIVKKLLKVVDKKLCFIKGREMMTPLHCAAKSAATGSEIVIKELLSASSKCITMLTTKSETALHTAVRNGRYKNFKALVEWIKKERVYNNLSWKDQEGNTILHIASSRRQDENLKMIELLLSNSSYFVRKALKINEKNTTGFTALDVLMETKNETLCNGTRAVESPTEPSREERIVVTDNAQGDQNQTDVYKMEKILKHAGAKKSQITCCIPPHSEASKTKMVLSCGIKWLLKVPNFLSFKVDKDTSSDIRNALLVIFVLIVAVTYQTGVNPPGGLWQDNESITSNNSTNSTKLKDKTAGTPVWFDQNPNSFQVLMLCNYAGFLVSLVMVFNLTEGYPLRGPILLALLFMLLTYGLSIRLLFLGSGTLALLFHGMILTVPLPVALVLLVATANWIWEIK